ncbi:hypothetical protein ElyMa_004225200 [Elysia marginata]|uniref:Uncharacterized protein n=1 Tax=Elysia marginata TaxID=1093978 RepID=A0AAV4GT30_9GAST|nr:hypothetical protein ElyMa_004225200 [Elysia marginata]
MTGNEPRLEAVRGYHETPKGISAASEHVTPIAPSMETRPYHQFPDYHGSRTLTQENGPAGRFPHLAKGLGPGQARPG